jgi:glucose/arabinose dehydrogenase
VYRVPYADGDRTATALPENLGLPATYATGGRWTHGLARSVGGQLYTSRGAYGMCISTPASGEISTIGADGTLTTVAAGFRNPMYMRCHRTDEVCAAMELGEDTQTGAVEKMISLRANTDYGYPCCQSMGRSAPGGTSGCSDVTKEDAWFPLSDTPFGFDWEPGLWPAPFTGGVFVALHGSFYSSPRWQGAAIVYAPTDPTTHMPVQDWAPFQGGWAPDDGSILDRPSDIAFSKDGRMFIADDASGHVYWMAPTTLAAAN